MDLAGKVALVTGASRGVGEAIARRFAREGLRVIALGRSQSDLERVGSSCGAVPLAVDLTDTAAVLSALDGIQREVGSVDVLVNNAGIAESQPLGKTTDEVWTRTLAVDVTAPFVLCRALIPAMSARGWGRVVNVASNAGLTGYAYSSAYCAAKHALVGLTRALAAEFARTGVTINAVCPGFVDTELAQRSIERIVASTGRTVEQARAALEQYSPQRRLITVDEVANLVFSLLPHEARGLHGQALVVDGGQVMQ